MQYLTEHLWLVWLIVSIGLLLLELTSGEFFIICFSIGAVAALIASAVCLPLWAQVLIWATCSVLCLLFVRPWLKQRLHANIKERKSNADALIGKHGIVTETIQQSGYGYVKIDGDEWRSVSNDGQQIDKGTAVYVVARESIVLTVAAKTN